MREFAPYIGKPEWQIPLLRTKDRAAQAYEAAKMAPSWIAKTRKKLVEKSPVLFAQAKEEWQDVRPLLAQKVRDTTKAKVDATLTRLGFAGDRAETTTQAAA